MENIKNEKVLIEGKLDHLNGLKNGGVALVVVGAVFMLGLIIGGIFAEITALSIVGIVLGVLLITFGVVILWLYGIYKTFKLVVTDRRIYGIGNVPSSGGRGMLRKSEFSLPLKKVSSVGKEEIRLFGKWNMVSFGTSSGNIQFGPCANVNEICDIVNNIIGSISEGNTTQNNNVSAADELKKYNELLKSGAITQEEYDNKKKELLK